LSGYPGDKACSPYGLQALFDFLVILLDVFSYLLSI